MVICGFDPKSLTLIWTNDGAIKCGTFSLIKLAWIAKHHRCIVKDRLLDDKLIIKLYCAGPPHRDSYHKKSGRTYKGS